MKLKHTLLAAIGLLLISSCGLNNDYLADFEAKKAREDSLYSGLIESYLNDGSLNEKTKFFAKMHDRIDSVLTFIEEDTSYNDTLSTKLYVNVIEDELDYADLTFNDTSGLELFNPDNLEGIDQTTLVIQDNFLDKESTYKTACSTPTELGKMLVTAKKQGVLDPSKFGYSEKDKYQTFWQMDYRKKELENLKYIIVDKSYLHQEAKLKNGDEFEGGYHIGGLHVYDMQENEMVGVITYFATSSENISYYENYTSANLELSKDLNKQINSARKAALYEKLNIQGELAINSEWSQASYYSNLLKEYQ